MRYVYYLLDKHSWDHTGHVTKEPPSNPNRSEATYGLRWLGPPIEINFSCPYQL